MENDELQFKEWATKKMPVQWKVEEVQDLYAYMNPDAEKELTFMLLNQLKTIDLSYFNWKYVNQWKFSVKLLKRRNGLKPKRDSWRIKRLNK